MQVYADLLLSRAKKRQQLLAATSVSIGRESRASPLDGGPLEDEDEDADEQAVRGASYGRAGNAAHASAGAAGGQASLLMEQQNRKGAKRRRKGGTEDDVVSQDQCVVCCEAL